MGMPAGGVPVRRQCEEPAGRLLVALRALGSTSFAFKPGKLSGGLLTTCPAPSKTTKFLFVLGLAFFLPAVDVSVVVGGSVGEFVVVREVVSAETEARVCRVDAGMHRSPSDGQSTTREKNFRKG